MKARKTEDHYDIIAHYSDGKEIVTTETNFALLKENLKLYRENEPQTKFTWKKRRVKKGS